jgi:hypothetical protein
MSETLQPFGAMLGFTAIRCRLYSRGTSSCGAGPFCWRPPLRCSCVLGSEDASIFRPRAPGFSSAAHLRQRTALDTIARARADPTAISRSPLRARRTRPTFESPSDRAIAPASRSPSVLWTTRHASSCCGPLRRVIPAKQHILLRRRLRPQVPRLSRINYVNSLICNCCRRRSGN